MTNSNNSSSPRTPETPRIEAKAPAGVQLRALMSPGAESTPSSVDREARTIDVCFYSGAQFQQYDWLSGRIISVVMDPAGCDFTRIANGAAPILDCHQSYEAENQLGRVTRGWIGEDGRCYATLQFSADPAIAPIWEDYAAGIRRSVSVGATVYEFSDERDADGRVTLRTITNWMPTEISAVPVPADPGALTLSLPIPAQPVQEQAVQASNQTSQLKEKIAMPETTGQDTRQTGADSAAIAASAATAERERIRTIQLTGTQHGLDASFVEQHVNAGTQIDEFNRLALSQIAARQAKSDTRATNPAASAQVTMDQRDKTRVAMTAALEHRVNPKSTIDGDARQFVGMSLFRMAEESIVLAGGNPRGADRMTLTAAAFNLGDAAVKLGMHSTSDFPNILAATANKQLLAAYEYAAPTYKIWAKASTVSDFKTVSRNRLGEFPALKKVSESGEITFGSMPESKETYAIATYARRFAITRQAIINDDLSAFSQVPQAIAVQVALLENSTVYGILNANAAMADGTALFHANHSNLAASGTVINITNLNSAQTAMMLQKGQDGVTPLNLVPRFLIVPVTQRLVALQYTNAPGVVVAKQADFNPFNGALQVVADAQLDATSTTAWYLAADPTMAPTVEYAYLEGSSGPRVEQRVGWEVEGLEMKAVLDFGAKAIDWKPMYKNPGA